MPKLNNADSEAVRLSELQEKLGAESSRRIAGTVMMTVLLLFLVVFGILVWLPPVSTFSENENRILQTLPEFGITALAEGRLTNQLSGFYSDQFPCRGLFIAARSYTEVLTGRREVNGVVQGRNGVLAERYIPTVESRETFRESLEAVFTLCDRFSSYGLPCTVSAAPPADCYLKAALPESMPVYTNPLPDTVIDLSPPENTDGAWFQTDHHWTADGAYYAYFKLGASLGYEPFEYDGFLKETVSESFYGTAWSKSGLYLTAPDRILLLRYAGDSDYFITGDASYRGFYDMNKLAVKDKYAVFLGGNHGHITVSDGTDKPRLLLIKDSFANAAVPFLARHFELEIIDPRYFYGDIDALAQRCDRVLFLYGIASFGTDRDLVRLTLE